MVYFPDKSDRIFTRRNSKMAIAICWIVPVLILLPSLTGKWGKHALDCKTRGCTIIDHDRNGEKNGLPFKKFLLAVGVSFPTFVLIVANTMIYIKVNKIIRLFELFNIKLFKGATLKHANPRKFLFSIDFASKTSKHRFLLKPYLN